MAYSRTGVTGLVELPSLTVLTRASLGLQSAMTARELQSSTNPPVRLISVAVIVRAQSDEAKTAALATSS